MSPTPSKTLRSNGIDNKLTRIAKTVFSYSIKLIGAIAILLSASVLLSKLGTIHGKELPEEYFSNGYPAILTLLDSEVFMGFIFFVTVAILVYVVYLMWQLHEVAVHRAAKMSSAHSQIVFALSLCEYPNVPSNISAGDGSKAAYKRIDNDKFQLATVPEPLYLQGWQIIDEINRAFSNLPPSGYSAPVHLVTPDNVSALISARGRGVYDPDNGYREAYLKIWKPE